MNPEQFTQQVLGALQLDACAQARTLLDDYAGEALSMLHQDLTRRHLETCADCRALHRVMLALNTNLPTLRSLRVTEDFTASVMIRTVHAGATTESSSEPSRLPKSSSAAANRLRAWLMRPRFALETAYAMTVVLMLFSGLTGVNAFDIGPIERLANQASNCLWERACPQPIVQPPQILQQVSERISQRVEQQSDQIESSYESSREKWLDEFRHATRSMQSWAQEKHVALKETITALTR